MKTLRLLEGSFHHAQKQSNIHNFKEQYKFLANKSDELYFQTISS